MYIHLIFFKGDETGKAMVPVHHTPVGTPDITRAPGTERSGDAAG
jgi:hypothetical protein